MINSDSTKIWQRGSGAPVGLASSAFLETPAELHIKSHVRGVEQISFHGANGYTVRIHEFMVTTIKFL